MCKSGIVGWKIWMEEQKDTLTGWSGYKWRNEQVNCSKDEYKNKKYEWKCGLNGCMQEWLEESWMMDSWIYNWIGWVNECVVRWTV